MLELAVMTAGLQEVSQSQSRASGMLDPLGLMGQVTELFSPAAITTVTPTSAQCHSSIPASLWEQHKPLQLVWCLPSRHSAVECRNY